MWWLVLLNLTHILPWLRCQLWIWLRACHTESNSWTAQCLPMTGAKRTLALWLVLFKYIVHFLRIIVFPHHNDLPSQPLNCGSIVSEPPLMRMSSLALLYEPSHIGWSQVWPWSTIDSWAWTGGTTLALCPRVKSQGKVIVKDIREPSLKNEEYEAYIIMVFRWVSAYDKKEGAQMSGLSTWNRVDRKQFVSQNPEGLTLHTRAVFSWLRELGPETIS